ncbi:MAG: hypothetical protein Q8T11_06900 [Elusimicrobiota bacterium]|nr:hypothetical protein [Elusimicrobiota bacterium]
MLSRSRPAALAALLLTFGCAGGRAPETAPPPDPWVVANEERLKDQAEHEAEDRKELVRPAPDFWRPESRGRALKLTLFLEKTTLRTGEPLRYRLEAQNIGEKEIFLHEDPSFIKTGKFLGTEYQPLLKTPDGVESKLSPPLWLWGGGPLKPAEVDFRGMTDAEAEVAMKRLESRDWTKNKLILYLRPGETIVTRPDDSGGRFRELKTDAAFDRPGKYSLRFVYDQVALADNVHAESLPVVFEVAP